MAHPPHPTAMICHEDTIPRSWDVRAEYEGLVNACFGGLPFWAFTCRPFRDSDKYLSTEFHGVFGPTLPSLEGIPEPYESTSSR